MNLIIQGLEVGPNGKCLAMKRDQILFGDHHVDVVLDGQFVHVRLNGCCH